VLACATNYYDETEPRWPLRLLGDVCGHCATWVWISTDCIMSTNSFYLLCFFLSKRAYPIFPNHISRSQCNSLCHVTQGDKGVSLLRRQGWKGVARRAGLISLPPHSRSPSLSLSLSLSRTHSLFLSCSLSHTRVRSLPRLSFSLPCRCCVALSRCSPALPSSFSLSWPCVHMRVCLVCCGVLCCGVLRACVCVCVRALDPPPGLLA
jgi:hypothetical protein